MSKKIKKSISSLLVATSILSFFPITSFYRMMPAHAATALGVVINEVSWMGTVDDSNDEWIELYNNSTQGIDLTGWYIEDDGSTRYTLSGVISSGGYFLIEDSEDSVRSILANAVIGLSLANSGDSLILKNVDGTVVDAVNSSGDAWFAGDNTDKTSMERVDSTLSGDDASNWSSNVFSNGAEGRNGSRIQGTPGSLNSASQPAEEVTNVELAISNNTPRKGEKITVSVNVTDVSDLFSYGLNVQYDPAVFRYESAQGGSFLNKNQTVSTSFQAGLEDGKEGNLIAAEARTEGEKGGTNGSGMLFSLDFTVIGDAGSESDIIFDDESFLSTPERDIFVEFTELTVTILENIIVEPVRNLAGRAGVERYTIEFDWDAPSSGADSYRILRKNVLGNFEELIATEDLQFIDDREIVPTVSYAYQIVAVRDGMESIPVEVKISDARGILGDNNRTDRVDGRDLENLARRFAEEKGNSAYLALVDTTYDGRIDGKDLIDMAANWAFTYEN
ncbi:lamin tail domain-containing protein [Candidatus Peregrinibacteria bacterium]|nr:lamin tail domain-containing protein [Candidatus Peregrinibacteria bacterium]